MPKEPKYTTKQYEMTVPFTARFWLEERPEKRIGHFYDTLIGHDEPALFLFDNPKTKGGKRHKGRMIVTFNGETPFLDDRGRPVYAFEIGKQPKGMRSRPLDRRNRIGTTRTQGCKYTVTYLDENGRSLYRALDPEVIIIH